MTRWGAVRKGSSNDPKIRFNALTVRWTMSSYAYEA
jgi:hypothetical protein